MKRNPAPGKLLAATLSLAALLASTNALSLNAQADVATQPVPGHGIDIVGMDKSAMPCTNFYEFANGNWVKTHPIPADRASIGLFSDVADRNDAISKQVLEAAAAQTSASESSAVGKVGAFYRAGMDTAAINAAGIRPLMPELNRIAAVNSQAALIAEMARLQRLGVDTPLAFGASQDAKNSTQVIAEIDQSGLGLPNRDYYLNKDAASIKLRTQYQQHVAKMMQLLDDSAPKAANEAAAIMAFETKLAQVSLSNVAERDPNNVYHRMTVRQLVATAPGYDWQAYLTELGVSAPKQQAINVAMPVFVRNVAEYTRNVPLATWRTYLRYHLASSMASYLSDPFVNENFDFNGRVLQGVTAMRPRWKRVQRATDEALGEDLGKLWVAKAFSPEAKQRATAMVLNLKATLRDDIAHLTWMGPSTRAQALAKCDAMMIKVGYPDHWRDYSALHVTTGSYVLNVMRANAFEFDRQVNKIGKPVDRTEWGMTPPTVNAYYDPTMNEIVFPAGILQPPFFDVQADDASNYGSIGAVIGHEMTHGFDDEGHQFDSKGNLRNWWTAQDQANFMLRAKAIQAQYSSYTPVGTTHINGALTLGENIADNGGTKIAYLALQKDLAGKPQPTIDGFTPDQRFFIAFGENWRANERPQSVLLQLATDPHSPDEYRVIGVLANMPEFYEAFGCPVPDSARKTSIW